MPFTFSHPAIVLPLKKMKPGWFSLSGLVFGSLAPDFEYLMAFSGNYDYGHTHPGIFLFDLPLTFFLSALFHLLIRNPLLSHLPAPFDRKYSGFLSFNFATYFKKHWLVFFSSALLGIFSHLVWDSLGKPEGYLGIYHLAPSYFERAYTFLGMRQPFYHILEHINSLIALLALLWVLIKLNEPAETFIRPSILRKVLFWFLLAAGTFLIFRREQTQNPYYWSDSLPHQLVVLLSAGTITLVAVAVLFQLLQYRTKTSDS
ncbi:DUF4184 family protein [Telluribacter sp.]|jgi:hypothetical protein|uniref:DUF4184 family protein n=1 Tax=Telluribacter sp. TaxID=1978767 RepID=UPI002E0D2EBC|nr:DUF4184 family protein [Telluribacter sp.]